MSIAKRIPTTRRLPAQWALLAAAIALVGAGMLAGSLLAAQTAAPDTGAQQQQRLGA